MEIRQSLETFPTPIDALVTLEELETGTIVTMSDSLTKYFSQYLGDGETFAHNFSTTMSVLPGRHYRLTATRSDGATASATGLVPVFDDPTMVVENAFAYPSLANDARMRKTYGTISTTRHLAMVLGRESIPTSCRNIPVPNPIHQEFLPVSGSRGINGDTHVVQLSWLEDSPGVVDDRPSFIRKRPDCDLGPKQVVAIASGEPWPFNVGTTLRELGHITNVSNIQGGIGYLAGVHTRVFPFAGCVPISHTSTCTITFSPSSAALKGTVLSGCTGLPVEGMEAVLLSDDASGIRSDTTDASGVFHFQGLVPGSAHSLTVKPKPPLSPRVTLEDFLRDEPGDFLPLSIGNIFLEEAKTDSISIAVTPRRECTP